VTAIATIAVSSTTIATTMAVQGGRRRGARATEA
jgi:hypothetical protein